MVLGLKVSQQARILSYRLQWLVDHSKLVLLLRFLCGYGPLLHLLLVPQNLLHMLIHLHEYYFIVDL